MDVVICNPVRTPVGRMGGASGAKYPSRATTEASGSIVVTATFPDFPTNVATRVDAWTR